MTRVPRSLVAGLALAALIAGAVAAQERPLRKAIYTLTTKAVSVGLSAQTSLPLTLGYWKAEGLDVDVTTLDGSTAGLQQLAAGNIQFTTVGPEVALIARAKGVKVKAFYTVSGVTIFRVVVLRDSPIQSVADLKGKTIGVAALASGAVPVARALLAWGKLDPDKDVKWLAVGTGGPAAVALTQKHVDAFALWSDFQASLENRGLQFRELTAPFLKDVLGQVVIARDDFLTEHADVAVAFGRGLAKATLFALSNPEAAIRIHFKLYPESRPAGSDEAQVMREALHVFHARVDTERPDVRADKRWGVSTAAQWNRLYTIYKEQGLIAGAVDVNEVFTTNLIDDINRFDAAAVMRQAREYR